MVKSGLTEKVYPWDVVGLTTILLVECNLFGNTLQFYGVQKKIIYGKHNTQMAKHNKMQKFLLPSALRMLSWALGIGIYRQWYWKRGGNKNLILNTDIEADIYHH